MTLDVPEDATSSLQSPSPDDSGDPDTADMAEQPDSNGKPANPPRPPNGQNKTASSAKDPTRPRRKKARRACHACQRAHLTCGDERPCQRCIKRGLQDQCQDGVRKKAKYLHDAPNEALLPGMGLRGGVGTQVQYLSNLGRGQHLPPDAAFQPTSANEAYVQQQALPTAYPTYVTTGPQSQMGPPLTDGIMAPQPYSNQHSPISSQFSSGPSVQPSPMQSMASALQSGPPTNGSMLQTPFGGNVFDMNDPMQYNFDPSSFNFGNHYGALEFGMLGHMSSGAAETPPNESTAAQINAGNSASYPTPTTMSSTCFGGSPTNAQSYFYPQDQGMNEWASNAQPAMTAQFDQQSGLNQDVAASIGIVKQEAPPQHAYPVGAGSSNFASPTDSSSTRGMMSGFEENSSSGPNAYQGAKTRPQMQDRAAQQRHPRSKVATPAQSAPQTVRRARDTSAIYESVKQPYSYTNGFHSLTAFLQRRFSPQKTLQIAKALASIRPSFISCTKNLNRDDLVFMEKCFQRTLWEYEDFIDAYGTPTIVCRRTGEVAAVGKEFCDLTGWKEDVLLGKQANLNVNTGGTSGQLASSRGGSNTPRMPEAPKSDQDGSRLQPVFLAELLDDDSAIAFYEDFARLAFGDSRGSVTTRCKLLKYQTKADVEAAQDTKRQMTRNGRNGNAGINQEDGKVECTYCWTVKRDVFDIPMLIVMNVSVLRYHAGRSTPLLNSSNSFYRLTYHDYHEHTMVDCIANKGSDGVVAFMPIA
ncbi:MAG: hypothetical protein Q9202_002732 [Teloschistes flavicans]